MPDATDRHTVTTAAAPQPVGRYPHARRVGGLLFLSGLGPRAPGRGPTPGVELDAAGEVMDHDIEAQVHAVFANVRAVLEAAGSSWERLVDVTVFLTDMRRDFATVRTGRANPSPLLSPASGVERLCAILDPSGFIILEQRRRGR